MKKIVIISSSIRDGRLSPRVALFLRDLIAREGWGDAEILDLAQYNFPLFTERWAFQKEPSDSLREFTEKFNAADAVILLSPVYNATYSAALKNVVDLYYKEWYHKPVGIVSATYGPVPGIATAQQIATLMLKMGAHVAPVSYTAINIGSEFDENGTPTNAESSQKLAAAMLHELQWITQHA